MNARCSTRWVNKEYRATAILLSSLEVGERELEPYALDEPLKGPFGQAGIHGSWPQMNIGAFGQEDVLDDPKNFLGGINNNEPITLFKDYFYRCENIVAPFTVGCSCNDSSGGRDQSTSIDTNNAQGTILNTEILDAYDYSFGVGNIYKLMTLFPVIDGVRQSFFYVRGYRVNPMMVYMKIHTKKVKYCHDHLCPSTNGTSNTGEFEVMINTYAEEKARQLMQSVDDYGLGP